MLWLIVGGAMLLWACCAAAALLKDHEACLPDTAVMVKVARAANEAARATRHDCPRCGGKGQDRDRGLGCRDCDCTGERHQP